MQKLERPKLKDKLIQMADELAFRVYDFTKKFPKEELYGLTSQLRRAIISVALNGYMQDES